MADRILLVMAEDDGTPVAGALNLFGSEALYGRNWGSDGAFKFLHFEACYYQAIDFAIENRLADTPAPSFRVGDQNLVASGALAPGNRVLAPRRRNTRVNREYRAGAA
jgi:hypothetical protein